MVGSTAGSGQRRMAQIRVTSQGCWGRAVGGRSESGRASPQVAKLRNHLEGLLRWIECFTELVDKLSRRVPEKLRCLGNVGDTLRREPHESGASCVRCHGIVGEDKLAEEPGQRGQRPIPL